MKTAEPSLVSGAHKTNDEDMAAEKPIGRDGTFVPPH